MDTQQVSSSCACPSLTCSLLAPGANGPFACTEHAAHHPGFTDCRLNMTILIHVQAQGTAHTNRYIMRVKESTPVVVVKGICDQLANGFSIYNFSLPFLGACDLDSKLFNLDDFGAAEGPTDWKFVSFKVAGQV
jgi:hypothetical protein